MKKVLAVIILAGMTLACGVPKQLAKDCGGDFELGCRQLFGTPDNNDDLQSQITTERERNDQQDQELADLKSRMSVAEVSIEATQVSLDMVNDDLATLYRLTALNGVVNAIQAAQIAQLQVRSNTLSAQIITLQSQANSAQAQITALQAQDSIVDYLDCAVGNVVDGPGYDEVILRTKSGKLIAYFKDNGSREFLTLLTPGSYRTTDQQACSFTVNSAGLMCDGLGCR